MRCLSTLAGLALTLGLAGCNTGTATGPSAGADRDGTAPPPPPDSRMLKAPRSADRPEVSWDTPRDRRFAEFLQDNSGGMIKEAAVGIERKGELRVELDESTAPEDTLDLTRSLMEGARKDFPDSRIVLMVYDPHGEPILTARHQPGEGIDYQLAGAEGAARAESSDDDSGRDRAGVTEHDREFARWAEQTAGEYLRFVQADLEHNGRLWFGITRAVKPDDLPDLAESLLEGAKSEFPGRTLRAVAFDPDGERIGTATLDSGRVRWER